MSAPSATITAIHQPGWLPRLATLGKLASADTWVALTDVQFARRDYQHRCRLAPADDPANHRWLSIPVHLPHGRATLIRDVRIIDPAAQRHRVSGILHQHYRRTRHWPQVSDALKPVLDAFDDTDHLVDITLLATQSLLDLLGWPGQTTVDSALAATTRVRPQRSARLADLTAATGAGTYLCGRGGARYLELAPFHERDLWVEFYRPPEWPDYSDRLSALHTLMTFGPEAVSGHLQPRKDFGYTATQSP